MVDYLPLIQELKSQIDLQNDQIERLYEHAINSNDRLIATRMALACAIGRMDKTTIDKVFQDLDEISQGLTQGDMSEQFSLIKELAYAVHKEGV